MTTNLFSGGIRISGGIDRALWGLQQCADIPCPVGVPEDMIYIH